MVQLPGKLEENSVQRLPMRLELGVDSLIHLEFVCNKESYHLKEIISGKIVFYQIAIEIASIRLSLLRKETFGGQFQPKT